jgi:hypothetical protein
VAAIAEGVSALFDRAGLFLRLVAQRRVRDRQSRLGHVGARTGGPRGEPDGVVIDSQSVKTTESGGPRGFDAGKKIKGRKRHIVTDTQGLCHKFCLWMGSVSKCGVPPERRQRLVHTERNDRLRRPTL